MSRLWVARAKKPATGGELPSLRTLLGCHPRPGGPAVVASRGTDWCMQVGGALIWPPGRPEFAEPNLADQDPADHYAELSDEIGVTARQETGDTGGADPFLDGSVAR